METKGYLDLLFLNFIAPFIRLFCFLSFIFFPLPFFIGFIVYMIFLFCTEGRRYAAFYLSLIGIIVFISAIILGSVNWDKFEFLNLLFQFIVHYKLVYLLNHENTFNYMPYIQKWLLSFNLMSFAISWIFLGLAIFSLKKTEKEIEKELDIEPKLKRVSKELPMDFEGTEHVLATGTTGSGKTANILQYIERRMADNSFVAVVDGKGGMKQYDLYTVMKKLAKKYDRKLYVLNQSDLSDPNASPYSPFEGLTATQVKDFIIDMSDWESDHYKSLASRYWQVMANVMVVSKIPMSFDNIIYFSYRRNFLELVKNASLEGFIDKKTYDMANNLANGEEGKQAELSIGRSAVIAEGDGSSLFALKHGWNLRKAYEENAVVIVLLNELNYPEFAKSTGKIVVDDIKALVGKLLIDDNDDRKKLLVLEEFGVYGDEGMEGLLNRARSAGIQTIVSLQTFADTDKISSELTRQIVGNCNNFLIMLNNDNDTTDRLSQIIGTRKKLSMTRQTRDGESTGLSSNRVVDSFILHPNAIKQIPKGSHMGYFYDKTEPNKVVKFKTRYVEI